MLILLFIYLFGHILTMDALQVIPLKGAMTNEVFQVNWPTKNGDSLRKVLVRLYGEGVDIFFNREEEVRTFECMSKHIHIIQLRKP